MSTPWSLLSYYYSGNDKKNIAEMFAVCNQGVYGFMGIIILLRGCFHLERVCNAGILRIVFYCCLIHFSAQHHRESLSVDIWKVLRSSSCILED